MACTFLAVCKMNDMIDEAGTEYRFLGAPILVVGCSITSDLSTNPCPQERISSAMVDLSESLFGKDLLCLLFLIRDTVLGSVL